MAASWKKILHESSAAADFPTLNQDTTGSAATLTTAQNFSITGDVTASAVSFDGSGAVALATSLASGVVDATALASNAVTNVKIDDDAVDSAEIKDGAVDPVHLAGLGANGSAGQVLESVGDGTFRWANSSSGDVTGIDGGDGITINDGNTATPEVALDAALTTVTSIYNDSLAIGVGSNKPRIKFEFDGTPAEGKILFGIDDDTDTLELVNSGTDANNQDILQPAVNRSVTLGASSRVWDDIHTRSIRSSFVYIGGTQVTSTASELNILDGVTATKDEINILDGVTATKDEINILDGVTSTTSELNILDGVTATASEINILDGVTATATELNLLDGVTATTTELNYVDGVTSNIQTQLNGKQASGSYASLSGDSGQNFATNDLTVSGNLTVSGTTTTINTATLTVEDKLIKLADVASPTTTTANGAGIQVEASATEAEFPELKWDNSGKLTGWTLSDYKATSNEDVPVAVMQFGTAAPSGTPDPGQGTLFADATNNELYVYV